MLQVLSSLQYGRDFDKIDQFTQNHVLHVYDVFDQAYLDKLLRKGTPKYLISDHFTEAQFDHLPVIGLPLWIENQTRKICKDINFTNEIATLNCFNFMINKKQVNRFLCIKLVEYFDLVDFDYTWSGVDNRFDMSIILGELNSMHNQLSIDDDVRSFLLSSIKLEKKFFEYNKISDKNNSSIANYGGNAWAWKNGLSELFGHSAISLITESVSYQKASVFTEKTLFSVLGLTFPLWVGGYNQAHEWNRLGFDTFDDIIDHSYQLHETLIERCYFAFVKNIDILGNKTLAQKLRQQHLSRLLKNRDFLLQNGLNLFIENEITRLPQDLQQVMPDILKFFRPPNP